MANIIIADRVQETSITTGTANIRLAGATQQMQSFNSGVGGSNTTFYGLLDGNGTAWEVGQGTLTSNGLVLSRTTILASSNLGNAISLSSSTHTVFGDAPAYLLSGNYTNFAITPDPKFGLIGDIAGNNANTGSWGEYGSTTGSVISLTNGVATDLISIAFPAGDWDMMATVLYQPDNSTQLSGTLTGVTTVSNSFGSLGQYAGGAGPPVNGFTFPSASPMVRLNLTTLTTVYVLAFTEFASGGISCTAQGFLRWRRVR